MVVVLAVGVCGGEWLVVGVDGLVFVGVVDIGYFVVGADGRLVIVGGGESYW